jgi:dihydropteroate synthase
MEYHEAANFLFDLQRYPPRKGTDATRALLGALSDPHDDLTCIQIAGSNGKGSTARMAERVLRETGLDVGLFTSPHLNDVRERVRVNGRKITKGAVSEFIETIREHVIDSASNGDAPTFFEANTVLALWEFARQEVDIAILEVGIGGRYDATSVVDPVASAVTSVTLEHTDMLGDTVEEIARDKAHVVGTHPLVTAETGDTLDAIREVAGDVVTVGDAGSGANIEVQYDGRNGLAGEITLSGTDWSVEAALPQLGAHQTRNAGVAAALCQQVTDLEERDLVRGLGNAHWPGRFEVMGRDPLIVLDGAHNPGGCAMAAATLDEFAYDDLHLVFGAMSDKDHAEMADALPQATNVYTCEPATDRAEDADVLARTFDTNTDTDDTGAATTSIHVVRSVSMALEAALETATSEDCVLVAGSLYTIAQARERWVRTETPKRVNTLDEARTALASADVTNPGIWRMRGKGVHRTLKLRVQPRQAQYLKEELLSLGGECAISGIQNQNPRYLDVVLMGTLAQHKRLIEKLDGQPYGLPSLAGDLKRALGIQADPVPGSRGYPWEERTAVMGIVNVTPDSFHDGSEYNTVESAVARAEEMVENGADILDIGGESTRPGAEPVPDEEEIKRIVPVIERLADLDALVSVDTRKARVARAALDAGADILNDVSGLEDPEMHHVAAEYDVPIVVMHSIETPVDPDTAIEYDDVVEDVIDSLTERILLAEKAGLDREQIIVDPGLGFAKTPRESFALLGRADEFHALGCPVLIGHSHKSMFDQIGKEEEDRLHATVAASAIAAERGADIIRVHDVSENVAAVRTQEAADPNKD